MRGERSGRPRWRVLAVVCGFAFVGVTLPAPAFGSGLADADMSSTRHGSTAPGHRRVCSPLDHGATGDGTTLDTAALQETIDSCVGGLVVVPRGTYSTGTIYPRSGSRIRLLAGAVLTGTTRRADWTGKALVDVDHVSDVSIEGGVFDGAGPFWWEEFKAGRSRPGNVVRVADSRNVTIRRVTLRNSPSWTLHILRSDHVVADHVRIRNPVVAYPEAANTDGIDIVSSRDVEIANCDVETADDGIAIKTKVGMGPVSGVDVHGCTLAGWAHGFTIGLETWEDVSDVVFRDSVIRASRYSNPGTTYFGAIALVSMYGADINDVTIERVRVEATQSPLFLRVQGGGGYPSNTSVEPGSLNNVVIRNYTVLDATRASAIFGDPRSPLGPITLDHVDINSTEGGTAADADGTINEALLDYYPSPRILGTLPAYGFYFRDVAGPVRTRHVRLTSTADMEGRPQVVIERADGVDTTGFGRNATIVHR
ncbi:MAG: right-handed parallel beta-helix repeat-containing protein [Actinobacteria bacterium]|nr:right-handed parallel beta-helix repeat-containing protein [Actinomycetota bacterium]